MKWFSVFVGLLVLSGSAMGEWVDKSKPPTLEHIMEVLAEAEGKIENADLLIETEDNRGRRFLYRHVYDSQGRERFEEWRYITPTDKGEAEKIRLHQLIWFDGVTCGSYRYGSMEETPAKKLRNPYLSNELPSVCSAIGEESLLSLLEGRLKEGPKPTIELIDGKVIVSVKSPPLVLPSFDELRLVLDPNKQFFIIQQERISHDKKLYERIICNPKKIGQDIWLCNKTRRVFHDDAGNQSEKKYTLVEVRVNVPGFPDSIIKQHPLSFEKIVPPRSE